MYLLQSNLDLNVGPFIKHEDIKLHALILQSSYALFASWVHTNRGESRSREHRGQLH